MKPSIMLHIFRTEFHTNNLKRKLHLRLREVTSQMFLVSGILDENAWARIPHEKRKDLQYLSKESIIVGRDEYAKGYKLFDPSSQKTFIEISVRCEEEPI